MTNKPDREKCAPGVKYDGSCWSLDSLVRVAEGFNNEIRAASLRSGADNSKFKGKKEIVIKQNKKYLLTELTDRLGDVCKDDLCWLKQKFVKKLNDEKINKKTFRPKGPQGKFAWLSTTNIEEVMKQYEDVYSDFKFLGAVPIDFDDLPLGIRDLDFTGNFEKGITKYGIVFNLDEHWKPGSHWVALYVDVGKFQIYFFDSYGYRPEKRIRKFVKRCARWCYRNRCLVNPEEKCHYDSELGSDTFMHSKKKNKIEKKYMIEYNRNRHQYKNSECGVYSINFILRLLQGESFEHITKNKTLDDKMNYCRNVYFRYS